MYCHQYLDSVDEGWFPLPDVTMQEKGLSFAIILQMGPDIHNTLKAYWTRAEQFSTSFFRKAKQDILRYLLFTDNRRT
jgi:hypothetical protein